MSYDYTPQCPECGQGGFKVHMWWCRRLAEEMRVLRKWSVKCPCGAFLPRPKAGKEVIECKKCGNVYDELDVEYPRRVGTVG